MTQRTKSKTTPWKTLVLRMVQNVSNPKARTYPVFTQNMLTWLLTENVDKRRNHDTDSPSKTAREKEKGI